MKKALFVVSLLAVTWSQTGCFDTSPQGCEATELEDGSVSLKCGDDAPILIAPKAGEAGEQGEVGETGASALVRVEEASAEQCMYGGSVVVVGSDADGDGQLGSAEEQQRFVVCQGVPGEATAPQIVTSEADVADCPTGGTQLDIGVDLDQSMMLEASEITQTFVVCNGVQGMQGAQGVDGEAPVISVVLDGAVSCGASGGDLVQIGFDVDDNGALDAVEVDASYEVCDGAPGTDGMDGAPGAVPLLRSTSEPAGANCANGGALLEIGLDNGDGGATANDGALAPSEVDLSTFVCNGADGADGIGAHGSVTRLSSEPAGANCAYGGTLVQSGQDDGAGAATADDGVLGNDEVDSTSYVCNGANLLSKATAEPAGANCATGGYLLELGLDDGAGAATAGDGVLDADEIDSSSYICNGANGMNGMDGSDGSDGSDGAALLVRKTAEPAGANCTSGGFLIELGLDDGDGAGVAGDATLANDEIDSSFYLCDGTGSGMDGADGHDSVIRTSAEAPGANCPTGGVKLEVGTDDNDNGTLDPGEEDAAQTQYLCTSSKPILIKSSLGGTHSCAVLSSGEVWCWGQNNSSQLGNGTTGGNSALPTKVVGISNAVSIALGLAHSCALLSDQTVRCWGTNGQGQLGNNSTTTSNVPVTVAGINNARALATGSETTCAIVGLGSVRCWGGNGFGQLGNGTTGGGSLTPVSVTGISSARRIASGRLHTCVIRTDGTMACWGLNIRGQLGDGTTANASTPVNVVGLNDTAAEFSAGSFHNCVVLIGGTMQCWGDNTNGQLGDGTGGMGMFSVSPVDVVGLGAAVSTAAGSAHSCALLATGGVRCWGSNGDGQLGNGTVTDSFLPVDTFGVSTAVGIAAGSTHTCALLSSGLLKCWGNNTVGQLGDGTAISSSLPVYTLF